jgi:signal transduction histidine kinase
MTGRDASRAARALRWVTARAEYLALGGSLATVAALVAWWAVFAQRMIARVGALGDELRVLRGAPADPAEALRAERLVWMIRGESAVFALALVTCVVVLFLLVRRHRQARDRMERMLQLTTHELKTPVTGVRALLQTLARGRVPASSEAPLLAQGIAACDELEHLVETILAYQRSVRAGTRIERLRAGALLDGVLAHRGRSVTGETLELRVAGDGWVHADADAVRVILENLLDNARKYGDGGAVVLDTAWERETWRMSVTDAGRGFVPDDAERLFEPFARTRGDGVTHGSGLGLHLARQCARAMGGDLRAESAGPGAGARFTLTLPGAPDVGELRV